MVEKPDSLLRAAVLHTAEYLGYACGTRQDSPLFGWDDINDVCVHDEAEDGDHCHRLEK